MIYVLLVVLIAVVEYHGNRAYRQRNEIIIKLNEISCAQRAPVVVRPSQMQRPKK